MDAKRGELTNLDQGGEGGREHVGGGSVEVSVCESSEEVTVVTNYCTGHPDAGDGEGGSTMPLACLLLKHLHRAEALVVCGVQNYSSNCNQPS